MDTIDGGKWLPNQELAWTLVVKAIERVRELENEIGCFFDRNPDGSLHGKAFAGQTFDRTVHKGDLTGIEIINRLMEQVWARPDPAPGGASRDRADPGEGRRHGCHARAPIAGVLFIDVRTGTFRLVEAKAVLLATGGGPTMYKYHTPSGDKTHGRPRHGAATTGCRCATWRWCSSIRPACSPGPDTRMTGTIIEEGLRGAGGYLLDGAKQRFMFNYDPRGERATRDLVSQSMYREMLAGRTTPNGGLYISMGHLGPREGRASKFKGMVERCADCGFDLAGGLVEVVPTAHYLMGGVVVQGRHVDRRDGALCARARTRAACTAPTGSAATASPTRPCMAASPARRWRPTSSAASARREPDMDVVQGAMRRAPRRRSATEGRVDVNRDPRHAARPDVGRRRHHPRQGRHGARARQARRARGRAARRPACRTATAPSTSPGTTG